MDYEIEYDDEVEEIDEIEEIPEISNRELKRLQNNDLKLEKLQIIYNEILEYEASQGYSLFKDHISLNNFSKIINFKKRMTFATFIKFIYTIITKNDL